ncbi:hypothetical protein [Nocardia tengchongensis]|uniref:hypothetical protein n=1 Tax=Nocardia tengchongensis TaxID=2055889 RepID=UPI00365133ED
MSEAVAHGPTNLVVSLEDLHAITGDDQTLWPVLPDWHELFAAVCGRIGDTSNAHPVTRYARALSKLRLAHHNQPELPGFAGTRLALVGWIDLWVLRNAPFVADCDKSLGEAVDRMALAHVNAIAVLGSERDEQVVHAAWRALSMCAIEWTNLVDEVVHGQPAYPTGQ